MGFCKRSAVRSSRGGGFWCEVVEGSTMAELVDMAIANLHSPLGRGEHPTWQPPDPPCPPFVRGGRTVGASKTRVSNLCSEVDQDQLFTTSPTFYCPAG